MRKNVIKIFSNTGFSIGIATSLKFADILDTIFNLQTNSYYPYNEPNDSLLYINKSSKHLPQNISQLPKSIEERLSKNSSNEEIFDSYKPFIHSL